MKIIDGSLLRDAFKGGARLLEVNKSYVDSLNVFPVPDGDTGTNMSMTMSSAIKELNEVESSDLDDIVKAVARGALKGARGNSGVILSQIIKGIANVISDVRQVTTKVFADALECAAEVAYKAVTKPKEGTILTVIRVVAESASAYASKFNDFLPFFEALLKKGEEILSQTPDMLPVLKKAGVVDSGGKGLLYVFEGFYMVLAGKPLPDAPTADSGDRPMTADDFNADIHDLDDIKYAYCTEYFIVNIKKDITEEDIAKLKDKLMAIGDSVIVIGDVYLVKVHVHTNQPNRALYYALQLGEIDKIKIENMLQQNRELQQQREDNKKPIAMLSVCAGDGIASMFKDLMVDKVVEGGQTMNPSVDDILSEIEKINADAVIVLPNNKNIILAAEQAKELTNKKVSVLPTKNIAQGIAAAIAFDPEQDLDTNCINMRAAFDGVQCGQVTHAVRTTQMDGFDLKEGDIIGLDDKMIIATGSDAEQTAKMVVDKMVSDDSTLINIYFGEGITEEEAQKLADEIGEKYDECDVCTYYGGQPHYYYLISIE